MKNIVLGIAGGIAAYKAADLASKLTQLGYNVLPVMTAKATNFVGPETFRSLTGNQVMTQMFAESKNIPHISLLEEQPKALIIAPATANIIGKIANGIADDILTTTVMAANGIPKIIVPSMNCEMWANPIFQKNMKFLKENDEYIFVEPDYGHMACGTTGKGRYPDNQVIIDTLTNLKKKSRVTTARKILIVSGGTREPIDDVRVITNLSSGKMGKAIEKAAIKFGEEVTLIDASQYSVQELDIKIREIVADYDILIMPAAISDYTVKKSSGKIKEESLTLELTKTKDILANIKGIFKVGFALEEEDMVITNGKNKLVKKDLNMIVANSLETLGSDEAQVVVFNKDGASHQIKGSKREIASKLIELVAEEYTNHIYANASC